MIVGNIILLFIKGAQPTFPEQLGPSVITFIRRLVFVMTVSSSFFDAIALDFQDGGTATTNQRGIEVRRRERRALHLRDQTAHSHREWAACKSFFTSCVCEGLISCSS